MEQQAIELKGLTKHYKDFSLQDVTFSVPTGSIMGFIGENGAGKTTTLKSILGILHTDGGTVRVLGKDPAMRRKEINAQIGVVLDDSFFSDVLKGKDINQIMAIAHTKWDSSWFVEACQRFSVPLEKPMKDFSKGMRAKLKLLTAIAHHPKLLILDEATSGLDPVVRSEILDIFQEFIEEDSHSILLSSHITSDLERVADYITFLHKGRVVFTESKDSILARYALVKCTAADAAKIDKALISGRRDTQFSTELLISDSATLRKQHTSLLLQPATLDDIMTFFAKEQAG